MNGKPPDFAWQMLLRMPDVTNEQLTAALVGLLKRLTDERGRACWFQGLRLGPWFSPTVAVHFVLHRDTLQSIILSENELGDAGLEPLLAALVEAPSLKYLNLNQTELAAKNTPSLFALIAQSSSLQHLLLSKNRMHKEFCRPLSEALKRNRNLLSLTINDVSNWCDDDYLWKSIEAHPQLREFHATCGFSSITDYTAAMLAALFRCTPALKVLNLGMVLCKQPKLYMLVEGLRHNTTLTSLCLTAYFDAPDVRLRTQQLARDILIHNVTIEQLPVMNVNGELYRNSGRRASRIARSRHAALILAGLKRFRRVHTWGLIGRDVIKILGEMILATRMRPEWEDPQLWPVEDEGHRLGPLSDGHSDAPRRPTKRTTLERPGPWQKTEDGQSSDRGEDGE